MKANTLYISRFFGSFGSWITYLGIALFVQENYGSRHVPWTFLIQTLPAFLFANVLCQYFKNIDLRKILIISHMCLAFGIFALAINPGLWQIYVYLIFSSLVSALALPLLNEGISQWFSSEKLSEVHTRLGAIQSCTLIFAPMSGGMISALFGYKTLFMVTMFCYISSAFFLFFLPPGERKTKEKRSQSQSLILAYRNLSENKFLKNLVIIGWCSMLASSLLNGTEFAIFKKNALSSGQIGLVISGWGIGNIFAFILFSLKSKKHFFDIRTSSFFFGLSIILFTWGNHYFVLAFSFIIAGFFSALLSGLTRAEIQKSAGDQSLDLWVFFHRTTSLIQMITYGMVGLLLSHYTIQVSEIFLILGCGFLCLATLQGLYIEQRSALPHSS